MEKVLENKIIHKLSLQVFVISGTLLGGYIVSNNPLLSHETIALTATYLTSGFAYIKTSKK